MGSIWNKKLHGYELQSIAIHPEFKMFLLWAVGFEVKWWWLGVGTACHSSTIPEPTLSMGGEDPEGSAHSADLKTQSHTVREKRLLWAIKKRMLSSKLSFV